MIKAVSAFVSFDKLVVQFIGVTIPANLCLEVPLNCLLPADGELPDFNDVECREHTLRLGNVFYPYEMLLYGPGKLMPEMFDIVAQGAAA